MEVSLEIVEINQYCYEFKEHVEISKKYMIVCDKTS